jgi:hypothetical protein
MQLGLLYAFGHAPIVAAQLAPKKRPTIVAKVRVEGCPANSSARGCVILLEPRIARNKVYHKLYTHLSAILSEATVFCVSGGHRAKKQ